MKKVLGVLTALATAALFSGCASIIQGSRQDVRVTSNPSGAVVRVNLNNQATTTPGMLTLNRKEIAYVLTFEKEGYKPVEVSLRRTTSGWLFGNIIFGIFGGIIGIVIDFTSGSAYKLTPGEVAVALGQMEAASAKKMNHNDVMVFVDFENLPKQIKERIRHDGQA